MDVLNRTDLTTLPHFLDAWNPKALPPEARRLLSARVAPPLCAVLEEAGFVPRVGFDLETLAEFRHNLADPRWAKLAEPCDPHLNPGATENDTFVVYMLNPAGEVWGCAASRLRWLEGSLADNLAHQTALAERPDRLPEGQRFASFGAMAEGIRDVPVAWGSSLWAHDKAPRMLVPAIMRMLHLWTVAHWTWSFTVSIGQPRIADRYGFDVHGYDVVARGARRTNAEGAATDYRLMIAGRARIRALVTDPGYTDLACDLSGLGM